MHRYSIVPFGVPAADTFLEKSAERAQPMSGREAEAFFDREWRRVRDRKPKDDDSQTEEVRRLILIGLACMRSCARFEP